MTEGDEMKAVTWHGKRDVRVDDVPEPTIQESNDAIMRTGAPPLSRTSALELHRL
jgi:hypothetical protein